MKALPDIERLVPHRGAMLWLDRVLESSDELIRTETLVRRDRLFTTDEGLPAWVGVELMAQTVASYAGMRHHTKGQPPRLGFLLGSRKYTCAIPVFPLGAHLQTEAREEIAGENGLSVFQCRILLNGEVVASGDLKAFQPADVDAYFKGASHG